MNDVYTRKGEDLEKALNGHVDGILWPSEWKTEIKETSMEHKEVFEESEAHHDPDLKDAIVLLESLNMSTDADEKGSDGKAEKVRERFVFKPKILLSDKVV